MTMTKQDDVKEEIRKLVDNYNKLVEKNEINKYNEEMTKKDFILPLFEALGWNVYNRHERNDHVSAEERISKGRVDYSFRINEIPKFFLEAKALKVDLDNPKFIEQAINYAWLKGCAWAILTDFESIKIFNAEWKCVNPLQNHLKTIPCQQFIDRFDELWLLSKESFEQGLLDKEAEKWGKKSKKTSVDKQLLTDFTNFREALTKNIKKNQEISTEDLDECVQRILDRLIFIRVCEDREIEVPVLQPRIREFEQHKINESFSQILSRIFREFDLKYNSNLFREHESEKLKIDDDVILKIIASLHVSQDSTYSYDFSAIDADVLGTIYEQYLGHILKGGKVKESHAHRKEQGIYYTPTYIVDYIVKNTIHEHTSHKRFDDVLNTKILDPACGSGSFLIKAFSELCSIIKERMKKGEKSKTVVSFRNYNGRLTIAQKIYILTSCIHGIDLDKQAVEISQLNLLLKILDGESKATLSNVSDFKKLLPMLDKNIRRGNSLIDDQIAGEDAFNWHEKFKDIMNQDGFDVIIGNPPYVRIQTLDEKSVKFFNQHYKSATKNYDIYALFVEKGLLHLKHDGVLGFILPSKFMNADYGEGLRNVISQNKSLHQVVDFKDFQIFDGATTYTCLLFLKKIKNKTFDYFELSNDEKLSKTKKLSPDIFKESKQEQPLENMTWNFVSDDSKNIMRKLNDVKLKLGDISDNIFQGLITGADKLYFVYYVEEKGKYVKVKNKFDNKEYLVEKEILKKLLKGKEIRKWKIDWQKIYIIYPYIVKNKEARLIQLDELKKNYPKTFEYFQTYEKELKAREHGKLKEKKNWHQFGRLQNIEKFEQAKIMTQVLASRNSFTFDEKGEYYFVGGGNAGGCGMVLKEQYKKDYFMLLGLLNSRLLEFYIKKISTPFRGGFYSYGKRFIEILPIVIPNQNDKTTLSNLAKKQLERSKRLFEIGDKKTDERSRIETEIKKTDAEIDELVYKIYGLTKEEIRIVEESLK